VQQPPYSEEYIREQTFKEVEAAMGFLWKNGAGREIIWALGGAGWIIGAVILFIDRAIEISTYGASLMNYASVLVGALIVSGMIVIALAAVPSIIVAFGAGYKYGTLKHWNAVGGIPLNTRKRSTGGANLYGLIFSALFILTTGTAFMVLYKLAEFFVP